MPGSGWGATGKRTISSIQKSVFCDNGKCCFAAGVVTHYRDKNLGEKAFRYPLCQRLPTRGFEEVKNSVLLLPFMIVRHRCQEDHFGFCVLCDLLDLEFPEMSRFNLEISSGDRNDAVLRRLNTLADFLAFTNVYLHSSSPHQSIAPMPLAGHRTRD